MSPLVPAKRNWVAATLWLLAGCTVVLSAAAFLYVHEADQIEQRLRDRETARVSLLASLFTSELRPTANDLRSLADGDGLRAFLSSGAAEDLARATRRALLLSGRQPNYDQIRYINERGMEVLRVNRGGVLVPPDQLQDKSDRPYFLSARSLLPNQIFISAFDLNIDNGQLEVPHKPVLRFSIPVFDATGRSRGVYVINYLGAELIKRLQEAAPTFAHRLRVLNSRGFWIKGAEPGQEWGFAFADRASFNLASSEPPLWTQFAEAPAGQTRFAGGLYTWQRTTAEDIAGSQTDRAVMAEPFLFIAAEVSAKEWDELFAGLRHIFLLLTPTMMMLVGSSAWFFGTQQRALVALRQSEEDLAVTLQSIGDAVLTTNTAGIITRMNPVAEQLTGWPEAEARGRPVGEIFHVIHAETRQPLVNPVKEVLVQNESHAVAHQAVLIARDGTERPIAERAAPIRDRIGRVAGVVMVFRDVALQRAAELKLTATLAELARERSRLHQVFESVPVGISFSIFQPDGGRSRLINTTHLKLCHITREQVDEPGIFQRITHPDDRKLQAELTRQLDAGEINGFTLDKRYVHVGGNIVWVMLTYQRQHYADGTHEDLSIVIDITDRKRIEEQSRQQSERLRALFESLPGLYVVMTPDFKIVTATDALIAATLTTREAIIGRNHFDVFEDNEATRKAGGVVNLRSSLERVKQTRVADTMAIQRFDIRRPDGSFEERYWSPINSPLIGPDGRVEYLIHRVEDVTDFMRQQTHGAEGALRARLEQMQAEMFQSSQRVQLANQQLRAANAELESFSYSVSHDLRAPLRHVQGYVDMLSREAPQLSEKGRRYLNTISEAGREMGELIDNLLAFSRMGRAEMREAVLDLNPLIELARHELMLVTPERSIVWKVAALPLVQGDAAMIRQVFSNLLGNAVKYTRGRNPATIEVGCEGEEDGRIVIFIRDNGAGFEMEYATKLFGVFQRLHRSDEFEGTGIGLASVRRIITRHGGRTWAQGVPNAGATFYITLKPADTPTVSPPESNAP